MRTALVYSTTARSKSCPFSARCPRRKGDAVAHPAVIRAAVSAAAAKRRQRISAGWCSIVGDISSARDLERERLIGQSDVFLEVGELERGTAPLRIGGTQGFDLERPAIDDDLKPVVVPLGQFRIE